MLSRNFKSASRFALVRFWNYSRDYSLNCTPLGPVTITYHCLAVLCKFLGSFGKEIFPPKGQVKLRKIGNVEDLMDLENWNLKWRIRRWTPNSTLPTWGSLLRGQLSGSVSSPFQSQHYSLLLSLEISLLFMCTPALTNRLRFFQFVDYDLQ